MTNDLLVSPIGEIKRPDGTRPAHYLHNGYVCVKYLNKKYLVHRLIAEKYIPNPENKSDVNHIDGNKLNNNVYNLEWATRRENVHHALRTGLHPLKETPVTNGVEVFVSQAAAGQQTGTAQPNINKCLKGLRRSAGGFNWKYVYEC